MRRIYSNNFQTSLRSLRIRTNYLSSSLSLSLSLPLSLFRPILLLSLSITLSLSLSLSLSSLFLSFSASLYLFLFLSLSTISLFSSLPIFLYLSDVLQKIAKEVWLIVTICRREIFGTMQGMKKKKDIYHRTNNKQNEISFCVKMWKKTWIGLKTNLD